ncbi:thioesterase II family protein [Micromonospora sp. NPDC049051]|uniref:thioesterase II family protein n=1 Tax=unclassified Micromonospora TaxID=2617518 RepID=UPI0037114F1D
MTVRPQSTIVRIGAVTDPRVRLLCFPQAGGGTATFRPLSAVFPPSVDLCALRLPGRESRRRETPLTDMHETVAEVIKTLGEWDDVPLALLGYCSGSFVAYQVARELTQAGRPPVRLIVLASPGPRVVAPERRIHTLAEPDLITYLRDSRITPESVLSDRNLFGMFEPAIRADFAVYENWDYQPGAPLGMPVTVVGAREDASVDFADLAMWQDHTSKDFTLRIMPGGHDFLGSASARLGELLLAELDL